ncbi:MAG: hypothetical protein DRI36_06340, partial [Caldiserica bacterium]
VREVIRKLVKSDTPIIRENCIITLSEIGTGSDIEILRNSLKDESERVREAAGAGIIKFLKREIK